MTDSPRLAGGPQPRFPGFDVLSQAEHWDSVTAGVVLARVGMPPDIRFFTPAEEAIAIALVDQLLAQPHEPKVPIAALIDARLAEQQTDGWHYDDMPPDDQAWRDTLADLDADAQARFSDGFAAVTPTQQRDLIQAVQDLGAEHWHGRCAAHVWSLWTRYACTAFYSHPSAWNEIGFSGPAYPRGYKNAKVDGLEGAEVRDARPELDPIRAERR